LRHAERRPVISLVAAGVRRGSAILAEQPMVQAIRRQVHLADFAAGRQTDTFSGCYATFDEARAAAPPDRLGYDHEAMTSLAPTDPDDFPRAMDPNDYAVMFWLRDILPDARRVFDLGGYVGSAYYAYRNYLAYPAGLEWTVCDVPAVVRAGQALADRAGAAGLRFTVDRDAADGADILLAAGCLQYLEEGSLHRLIASLRTRPRHVLVQRAALHPARSFVTLQVMTPPGGRFFCPYTVAARPRFIDDMRALGYDLADSWSKPRSLVVPLHPECTVPAYSGLYFRLAPETVSEAT